jgi:hypothetical protein
VKLEVEGKAIVADKEQIFPIPISKDFLLSIGFIEEAGSTEKNDESFYTHKKISLCGP